MIKIVYFDEDSASDYLDMSVGGKAVTTTDQVRDRNAKVSGDARARLVARFGWLPFLGVKAEAGAKFDMSDAEQKILRKTVSNTILTDYLDRAAGDQRIARLAGLRVSAPRDSMTFVKMFTPYMIIAKTEDQGVDLARLDEALAGAKGYYELLGERPDGSRLVLRFNIAAFRNSYGLADLARMRLVFHGILVGQTSEHLLTMDAEMSMETDESPITVAELVDGRDKVGQELLDVFDVVLAGVDHDE